MPERTDHFIEDENIISERKDKIEQVLTEEKEEALILCLHHTKRIMAKYQKELNKSRGKLQEWENFEKALMKLDLSKVDLDTYHLQQIGQGSVIDLVFRTKDGEPALELLHGD